MQPHAVNRVPETSNCAQPCSIVSRWRLSAGQFLALRQHDPGLANQDLYHAPPMCTRCMCGAAQAAHRAPTLCFRALLCWLCAVGLLGAPKTLMRFYARPCPASLLSGRHLVQVCNLSSSLPPCNAHVCVTASYCSCLLPGRLG